MNPTSYPTAIAGTVEKFFGITSIHDTIQEMTEWSEYPIDVDQAEDDYRFNLEAHMPPGWYIQDDTVICWPDADPVNLTELRDAVAHCIECFDISDYVIDALDRR